MSESSATRFWPTIPPAAAPSLPTIPGYEVLEELGRGGMGVVYKARQTALKRLVAVKVVRDGALAGTHEHARFRIEAEAAARMRHPHIVQIFEAGEHDGRPYFAMELVEGGSLEQHLGGRPQPARLAAELVRRLALAVDHAHKQQVVHRDLKPANILMQLDEASLKRDDPDTDAPLAHLLPKITDFGLAKRLDMQSTAFTVDGAVMGTASYMAPEQATGHIGAIGPATDVYALGAILYEMLTGRPPFTGSTWQETVACVVRDEPAPPTRLIGDVPADLETACLKCLEKDPKSRYESAAALASDLECVLEQRPLTAAPLTPRQRLERIAARDGYHLAEEIGSGPCSRVYRATHGALHQPVAIKVFSQGLCSQAEWQAQVRRNAETWSILAHPHLVPVQEAGWWDGAPYVVLEVIPQGSLASKLALPPRLFPYKGGAAGVGQALRLIEQLAEVVNYLHRQGVVHGNLKPSNVLLAADGIPRLSDLHLTGGRFLVPAGRRDLLTGGSSASIASPVSADTRAWLANDLAYLPPELAVPAAEEPRPNGDIYGLGAILYEMLAGRPPFVGNTPEETLEQVRTREPEPLSAHNPAVTTAIEDLVLRCLRKNPWRRPARVFDVILRLRALQENPQAPDKTRRRPLS